MVLNRYKSSYLTAVWIEPACRKIPVITGFLPVQLHTIEDQSSMSPCDFASFPARGLTSAYKAALP